MAYSPQTCVWSTIGAEVFHYGFGMGPGGTASPLITKNLLIDFRSDK